MSRYRRSARTAKALSAALGLGLAAATMAAVPATSVAAAPAPQSEGTFAAYTGEGVSAEQRAQSKAFFDAIAKKAEQRQAAEPGIQAVTVTYDDDQAPSFNYEIDRSAQIWNAAVSNVTLVEVSSGADFDYYEGNDSRGSYAYTDGRGHGYVFLDYQQNQVYDALRVVTHETGHVLGLPDNYSGPCSELMSGGGPGPSCTNAYPNANEAYRVDQNFAFGFAPAADKGFRTVR
ncbi:snapalysin [Streptomyces sp. DSM 42041]|uniref:Extracellular small neutral protease n=1 Tax=Streptomyces hazeniae TaxID=3075538 RepID=A0ABU2NUP1_9ACTN|nr:snapalysin [Streptomyces sp. DSM 42041]MDT0380227.1 snapalysin [Streptomyces sp. DSM 42041]